MIKAISNALEYSDIHKHLYRWNHTLETIESQNNTIGVGSNANFIDFTKTKATKIENEKKR